MSDRLQEIKQAVEQLGDPLDTLQTSVDELKRRMDTLDNPRFELRMRILSFSSSTFWGVGIALLIAAIAFVVACISNGGRF